MVLAANLQVALVRDVERVALAVDPAGVRVLNLHCALLSRVVGLHHFGRHPSCGREAEAIYKKS